MVCLIEKYRDFLPVTNSTPIITAGEGNTPLVRSRKLEKELGCDELYFKLEGCNPTGSFKDRGMVMAVAKAAEEGSKAIACASTGNTSAAAAAYGARFGLKVFVLVPKGNIALGKLAQAMIFGAQVISIDGNFDEALTMVRTLTEKHPITLVNSLNPYRIEGQKTSSFEIVDELGSAPDYLFIPLGNAGNITAYWKGFTEYHKAGKSPNVPKMMAFEAEGAAAIVFDRVIEKPETVATAIRIGNPASWKSAVAARDESGGVIGYVTDPQILSAYSRLAAEEGVFGEPASAASVAGLIKSVENGLDLKGKRIVCIITGNGLKDPDNALKQSDPLTEVPADLDAVERIMTSK
ncbi:MAG: threonine synthase [Chloroflexi bacterium]|jgi:threonine synthase|nr:threonine synthase [Chloroflexota bacterium]